MVINNEVDNATPIRVIGTLGFESGSSRNCLIGFDALYDTGEQRL